MSKYMILEAEPLTREQVETAMKRAHVVRSEAAWSVFVKLGGWFSKKFEFNAKDGSGLAHSA